MDYGNMADVVNGLIRKQPSVNETFKNGITLTRLPSEKETRDRTERFLDRQRGMKGDLVEALRENNDAVFAELSSELRKLSTDEMIEMLFECASYGRIAELHEEYCTGQSQSEMDKEAGESLDRQK
jgi:hypothetical protein